MPPRWPRLLRLAIPPTAAVPQHIGRGTEAVPEDEADFQPVPLDSAQPWTTVLPERDHAVHPPTSSSIGRTPRKCHCRGSYERRRRCDGLREFAGSVPPQRRMAVDNQVLPPHSEESNSPSRECLSAA